MSSTKIIDESVAGEVVTGASSVTGFFLPNANPGPTDYSARFYINGNGSNSNILDLKTATLTGIQIIDNDSIGDNIELKGSPTATPVITLKSYDKAIISFDITDGADPATDPGEATHMIDAVINTSVRYLSFWTDTLPTTAPVAFQVLFKNLG